MLCLLLTLVTAAQDLEALVEEALEANPSIDAMEFQVAELDALTASAGAWPDPMVGVEYSNAPVSSFGISDHPMAGLQLRAQQMLRPHRWSARQRAVAELRAQTAESGVDERRTVVRERVETAFWMLAQARLLEAVTRDHVARTTELLDAVRSRYETGRVGQHAVYRLEVLRDRLRDSLDDYARTDAELTARINGLRARSDGAIETPSSIAPSPPAPVDALLAAARDSRPTLARLQRMAETREAAAQLATSEAAIDPSVWAGYRLRTIQTATDPGTDLVSLGVGIPIPSGSGKRARDARDGHLAGASAARAAREADLDTVEADLRALVAVWIRAAAKAAVYETELVPAAQASLETALADYSVDKADFASLFDSEVALLELERARIRAVIETRLATARARAITGDPNVGGTP